MEESKAGCFHLLDQEFKGLCPAYHLAKSQASHLENKGTI